jgi:hypothetical protein
MSVFNAVEHEIRETDPPSVVPENKSDPDSGQDSSRKDAEDDLLFADNPEEDAAESNYAGTRLTFNEEELSDSFRSVDEEGQGKGFNTGDDEESGESVDESWAEAMLSDNDKPKRAPEQEQEPEPELEPEPKPEPEPEPKPAPEPAQPHAEPEPRSGKEEYDSFFIDHPDPDFQPTTRKSETPYHNLRHEPVAVSGNGGGRLRGFLWFLAIAALLGGAVSQIVWYQFDRLSAIPQLRPFYVQGCEIFRCDLEPLVDVQSIQSRKLVVKTNPDNRNQLVVDAVIINRASFEQPFPAIALTFSNLNNDIVAQSVFTPEEYLAGAGKGMEAMPPDTPVRILINIRDPGKDAVNYNIVFRANTP